MDFYIPHISIIGFGETGSVVGSLLNNEKQNTKINIIDPDEQVEGRILDLQHASVPQNNETHWNNQKMLKDSQLIFYTAGYRGKVGSSRAENAKRNLEIITSVFSNVQFKPSALIITTSNPAEASTKWIKDCIGKKHTVLSTATLLDTYRLQYILSKSFNVSTAEIETFVVGEYGSQMFPLWTETKIKGVPIKNRCSAEELDRFHEELTQSATKIRKTQLATKYGVAQTAITLANQFFDRQTKLIPIAFHAKAFLGDDLVVNWPFFVGKQHVIPSNIRLNKEEQNRWQKALSSIRDTSKLSLNI